MGVNKKIIDDIRNGYKDLTLLELLGEQNLLFRYIHRNGMDDFTRVTVKILLEEVDKKLR